MADLPANVRLTIPQATDRAVNFQRSGLLFDAEMVYVEILKVQPDHFDSTHNLGVIYYQLGRLAEALTLLERAMKLDPESVDALLNYGAILWALQRKPEALDAFERAIKLRPDFPEAHGNRGKLLLDLGRADEALEAFNRAMVARRGFVDALLGRSVALTRLKRFTDALVAFDRVLAIDPNNAEALLERTTALCELNRSAEALATSERAIAVAPLNATAYYNRGVALSKLGRTAEAAASYQQAIAIRPDHVEAQFNLANALELLRRFEEALAAIDRCLTLDPQHFRAWNSRGSVLLKLGRHDEAMASCDRALALKPDDGEAYYNRGNALLELERVAEAAEHFHKAVGLRGDHPDIPFNEGLALLLLGDLRRGFERYEGRFHTTEQPPQMRKFAKRRWTGFDIAGKRILLHGERGLGDVIHFARYVPLVAERGAEVILEVPQPLKSLLSGVKGVSRVYGHGERLPPFDVHQYLLSLGLVFKTELDSVPADIPYIAAPADRLAKWRKRLPAQQGLLRVGLVWSGNPACAGAAARSVGLARLAPLLSVPGVQFVSLQRELGAEAAAILPRCPQLIHFGGELADFADTAAVMAELDLVIGSDTAVIHLAGALGKPVWLLTKFAPDWRWMLGREDSPWYPSARLFRQTAPGAWAPVVERMAAELRDLAAASG